MSILITGGSGSFGRAFVSHLKALPQGPRRIIVYSRDEAKQLELREHYGVGSAEQLRCFLGDVRDAPRLAEAMRGVDWVVHAAAQKQVPAAEYNPTEAVATNVQGAQNIVRCAIETGVRRVLLLSTDKAVNPANLYGATKLTAERIFIAGNAMAGRLDTRFSVVRYGNVAGTRGSVIPYFRSLLERPEQPVPITAETMTRFWITLPRAVAFVMMALERMLGGEIFVPKLPAARIVDLATAILGPDRERRLVGIRPGEKVHERLISEQEVARTLEFSDYYLIYPDFDWRASERQQLSLGSMAYQHEGERGLPVPSGFDYSSAHSPEGELNVEQLRDLLENVT